MAANHHVKVKFTLPVGAVLGGLRHLGGGEFVGVVWPQCPGRKDARSSLELSRVPFVIDGVSDAANEADKSILVDYFGMSSAFIKAEEFRDPLDDADELRRDIWQLALFPAGSETPLSEREFAKKFGATDAEIDQYNRESWIGENASSRFYYEPAYTAAIKALAARRKEAAETST